jgi:uncharacterized membrane protein YedE/YeeE
MPITEFTPFSALAGGALIGLAAVLMLGAHGRVAGISGIASRLFPPYSDNHMAERIAFLVGLVAAPLLVLAATGASVAQSMPSNVYLLSAAGLLVGFGTVMANGCTSGHAVCGLSRLSVRSLVATLTFMLAAILTVFILRHVAGV